MKNAELKVCVLASGSKGNAIFVSNGLTSILIDAGLSGKEIERRLKSTGLCPDELDAVVVSHEHSDHTKGVGVLSRRFNLPVYINNKTKRAASLQIGSVYDIRNFECGRPFSIDMLTLNPFSISHDAEDPAGFTIEQNETKIGIATDLGVATSVVKERLKNCSMLILEANHDPSMLLANEMYPWRLKQRIKSRKGHLSNEEAKNLLQVLWHDKLKHVILAHISESNNTTECALNIVGQALNGNGCNTTLAAASQNVSGPLIYL